MTPEREIARALRRHLKRLRADLGGERFHYHKGYRKALDDVAAAIPLIERGDIEKVEEID